MRQGQLVRGYLITSRPGNEGAGKCMWAFAERAGRQYFVKEFLDPRRPRPDSMGTDESKLELMAQCQEFERRHWSVIKRIDPTHLDAGNLVTAVDFFHDRSSYYKITDRLHPSGLPSPSTLTAGEKAILLGTLADSLKLLHGLGIVHADLKPDNVLLHRPPGGLYTAKLIDFDDAYLCGEPPERTAIGGDARFAAPEWLRYTRGDPGTRPEDLTTAADMFAFGLVLHDFLVGALPGHDPEFQSAAEAVDAGAELTVDPRLPEPTAAAVHALTSLDPARRPSAADLVALVSDESALTTARRSARLRINLDGRGGGQR